MPTIADFHASPLFAHFVEPKYSAAIVDTFLSIAVDELEEHRDCMGNRFDLIAFLLAAHRLTRWKSSGIDGGSTGSVSMMSVSEMRQIVSSLSVSDEAGSESITFQQGGSQGSGDGPENFQSTEFGVLYLSMFKKFRCPRSWTVL